MNEKLQVKIDEKPTILVCTDSPVAATGFGRVCSNLITRWLATGKYRIVVMGTNDRGQHHELRGAHPDLIIEPLPYISEDPYGMHRIQELLSLYQPDLVFSLNDIWVWTADDRHPNMLNWFQKSLKSYRPYIPWIGYFPVDGRPWEKRWTDLVNSMTFGVSFCDYAGKVLSETPDIDMNKVKIIYHGHDTQNFFPLPKEDHLPIRKLMNIPEDAFLFGVINRNQPRKNIPAAIQAFKMFRDGYVVCKDCGKYRNLEVSSDCEICGETEWTDSFDGYKNSYMYLHMNILDARGYRIPKIQRDNKVHNVVTIREYDVAKGFPIQDLNRIYNTCDAIINPTTAGGYELTVAEAMAAGTPVIATRTTSITEQLEDGRGYLVRAAESFIMDDASHCHKHIISVNKLVDTMRHVYENPEEVAEVVKKALPFAESRNWDKSAKQFEVLFDAALAGRVKLEEYLDNSKQNIVLVNESNNFGKVVSMIPAVSSLAANPSINVLVAVKNEFLPLLEKLKINKIDLDHMWIDKKKLDGKFAMQMTSIAPMPEQIPAAQMSLGVPPADAAHPVESYVTGLRTQIAIDQVNDSYVITSEDKNPSRALIKNNNLDEKFKILIYPDAIDNQNSLEEKIVAGIISLLKKTNDVEVIIANANNTNNHHKDVFYIKDLSIREVVALMDQCDCVITPNEGYAYMSHVINTPFVLVQNRSNIANALKMAKARKADGELIGGVITPTQRDANGNPIVSVSSIFSKTASILSYLKKARKFENQAAPLAVESESSVVAESTVEKPLTRGQKKRDKVSKLRT